MPEFGPAYIIPDIASLIRATPRVERGHRFDPLQRVALALRVEARDRPRYAPAHRR